MNVLVIYESRGGRTLQAAEAIAGAARKTGGEVVMKKVRDVKAADVDQADAIFVGTWVQGLILFGVKPAGVDEWVPNLPSLKNKPAGVFCTYAFNPRGALQKLSDRLEARGAIIRGKRAFHRTRTREGADQFVQSVLQFVQA